MNKSILLGLCLFTLTVGICKAQTVPVEVEHGNDDQVGRSIAFYLKDAIRGSNTFRLLPENTPLDKQARIRVILVSIDANKSSPGLSSALSISFVFDSMTSPMGGSFVTSVVQSCGSSMAQQCAKNILPYIEQTKESIRKTWKVQWQQLTGESTSNPWEDATPRPSTTERPKQKPAAPVNPF